MTRKIIPFIGAVVVVVIAAGVVWWRGAPEDSPPPAAVAQSDIPEGFTAISPPVQVGQLRFLDTNGKRVTLGDFHGTPVLLNVWAKWCAPCIIELPTLKDLQKKVGSQMLRVVTVAVDEPDGEKVRNFLANRGWQDLPAYYDPKNELAGFFKIKSIPVSVLIDRNGFAVVRVDAPVDWYTDLAINLLQTTILQQP